MAGGVATRSVSAVNAVFLSYIVGIVVAGSYVVVARCPIAALYFVVPVAVGVFVLDSALSTANVVGLGLAVVAVVLLAM